MCLFELWFAQDICPTSGIAGSQGHFIPIFVWKFYTVLHDGFIKLWKDSLNRGQVGPEVFSKKCVLATAWCGWMGCCEWNEG